MIPEPYPIPPERQEELLADADPVDPVEWAFLIGSCIDAMEAQKRRCEAVEEMLSEAKADHLALVQRRLGLEKKLLAQDPKFEHPWLGRFVAKQSVETITDVGKLREWAKAHDMLREVLPTQAALRDNGYKLTKQGVWWSPDTKEVVDGMWQERYDKVVFERPPTGYGFAE